VYRNVKGNAFIIPVTELALSKRGSFYGRRGHYPGNTSVAFHYEWRIQASLEISFAEMTKKMVHVCENYDNWFLYNPTEFKRVVFVEFLRG
jgi:hypothetical protein